jgi:hypothetical protein
MKEHPARLKLMIGILLFFGIGLMIAIPTFFYLRKGPVDYWMPLLLASAAGGYGAWLIFFLAIRIYRWFSKVRNASQTK